MRRGCMSNEIFSIGRGREVLLICSALLVLVFPPTARANKAQAHICSVGASLGAAEAQAYLFGRTTGDSIPPDQAAGIATNLANASVGITAAAALFGEPLATYRASQGWDAEIQSKIASFEGSSYQHQASYIRSIAGAYRASLGITYVSSRPDEIQKNANCDSILFNLCYHYGRAMVGSGFDPGWEYRGSSSLLSQIINDGLAVAMDVGHRPFDGHHKKICCSFGSPAAWSEFPSFSGTSPPALYEANVSVLYALIGNANALDPVCQSGNETVCPSSPVYEKPETGKFAGRWRCSFGHKMSGQSTMTVAQDGGDIRGSYSSGGDSVAITGSASGDTMDITFGGQGIMFYVKATLSPDGRRLDGHMRTNQQGFDGPISCSK